MTKDEYLVLCEKYDNLRKIIDGLCSRELFISEYQYNNPYIANGKTLNMCCIKDKNGNILHKTIIAFKDEI